MAFKLSDITSIDLETTHWDPNNVDDTFITQIGAYNCGTETRLSLYSNPGDEFIKNMSPQVMGLTGITPTLLMTEGMDPKTVLEVLDQFLLEVGTEVVAGHNFKEFDRLILDRDAGIHDVDLKICDYQFIDTLTIAKHMYEIDEDWKGRESGTLPDHKLGTCFYGITSEEWWDVGKNLAHDAEYDAVLSGKIIEYLVANGATIEDLIELSSTLYVPTTMPFGKYKGEKFDDLPDHYVEWLIKEDVWDRDEGFQVALEKTIDNRGW